VKLWDPQYQKMVELADVHGFDGAGNGFRSWKPDKLRLEMAYKGGNPNTEEAREAQYQADERDKRTAEDNAAIGKRMTEQMSLTAGMTRLPDGSYYRQYSDTEKREVEAKQYLEIKPRVQADFAAREASMSAAKAAAQAAMGKCNMLTSAGNWDKVPKGAKQPYNDGYRLFSEAQKAWQAAVVARDAKDFNGITKYFPNAQSAVSSFREAAESFKKGDAAV
jgi:hypothetical protein